MAYFPFYVDITWKKGVILGGGRIAAGKIEGLLPFAPDLICIAPAVCDRIERLAESCRKGEGRLELIRREAEEEDLKDAFFVIAATDRKETNAWAAKFCRERGIPVNAVDDRKNCSFYFPALVRRGPVTVGISTGGCSPAAAAWLRKSLEGFIPEGLGDAVARLGRLRENVLEEVSGQRERAALFERLFACCEKKGFRLTDGELEECLQLLKREKRESGQEEKDQESGRAAE